MKGDVLIQTFTKRYATACGGNWTAMLMTAIKRGMPAVFESMEDIEYSYEDVFKIIADNIDDIAWIDPAGGIHFEDEEDPLAQYE